MNRKPSSLESALCHIFLVLAVAFALYPVLWVVALAFSGTQTPSPRVLPIPEQPTLAHFSAVVSATRKVNDAEVWLFGRQLGNSLVVSLSTALAGVLIAIPTAYALARFRFVGKETGVRALLATQMFPAVASAIPLYMI